MAKITPYNQAPLASSLVGTAGLDPSGNQITQSVLSNAGQDASALASAQAGNAAEREQSLNQTTAALSSAVNTYQSELRQRQIIQQRNEAKLKSTVDAIDISNKSTSVSTGLLKIESDIERQGQDTPLEWADKYKAAAQARMKEALSDPTVKNRPDVIKGLTQQMNSDIESAVGRLTHKGLQQAKDNAKSGLQASSDEATDFAGQSGHEGNLGQFEVTALNYQKTQAKGAYEVLGEDKGKLFMKEAMHDQAHAFIDADMRKNPARVIDQVESGYFRKFAVKPKEEREILDRAQGYLDANKRRLKEDTDIAADGRKLDLMQYAIRTNLDDPVQYQAALDHYQQLAKGEKDLGVASAINSQIVHIKGLRTAENTLNRTVAALTEKKENKANLANYSSDSISAERGNVYALSNRLLDPNTITGSAETFRNIERVRDAVEKLDKNGGLRIPGQKNTEYSNLLKKLDAARQLATVYREQPQATDRVNIAGPIGVDVPGLGALRNTLTTFHWLGSPAPTDLKQSFNPTGASELDHKIEDLYRGERMRIHNEFQQKYHGEPTNADRNDIENMAYKSVINKLSGGKK